MIVYIGNEKKPALSRYSRPAYSLGSVHRSILSIASRQSIKNLVAVPMMLIQMAYIQRRTGSTSPQVKNSMTTIHITQNMAASESKPSGSCVTNYTAVRTGYARCSEPSPAFLRYNRSSGSVAGFGTSHS